MKMAMKKIIVGAMYCMMPMVDSRSSLAPLANRISGMAVTTPAAEHQPDVGHAGGAEMPRAGRLQPDDVAERGNAEEQHLEEEALRRADRQASS